MDGPARDLIDKLGIVLRSLAPGYVLLGAIVLCAPAGATANGVRALFTESAPWIGLATGVLLGLTAYAVYAGVVEEVLLLGVVVPLARVWVRMTDGELAKHAGLSRLNVTRLARERWARAGTSDKIVAAVQSHLDYFYPWLIFLYCSGLLLGAGATYLWVRGEADGPWWLVGGAVGFLASGVLMDARITAYELWLSIRYPQLDGTDPPTATSPAGSTTP